MHNIQLISMIRLIYKPYCAQQYSHQRRFGTIVRGHSSKIIKRQIIRRRLMSMDINVKYWPCWHRRSRWEHNHRSELLFLAPLAVDVWIAQHDYIISQCRVPVVQSGIPEACRSGTRCEEERVDKVVCPGSKERDVIGQITALSSFLASSVKRYKNLQKSDPDICVLSLVSCTNAIYLPPLCGG